MKKSILFWMGALLMLSVSMISCSNDDESIDEVTDVSRGNDVESLDDNHKNIIGEWQLVNCRGGYHTINWDAEPGEFTLTFTKDGMVTVDAKGDRFSSLFMAGTYNYSFENVTPPKGKESITVLKIGESPIPVQYSFSYYDYNGDTMLKLREYAYDGYICTFKKVE